MENIDVTAISRLRVAMLNRNRAGKFSINANMVRDYPLHVLLVMSYCIIIKAEYDYVSDTFEYTAISERFDEIEPGAILPTYRWEINQEECTAIAYKVK